MILMQQAVLGSDIFLFPFDIALAARVTCMDCCTTFLSPTCIFARKLSQEDRCCLTWTVMDCVLCNLHVFLVISSQSVTVAPIVLSAHLRPVRSQSFVPLLFGFVTVLCNTPTWEPRCRLSHPYAVAHFNTQCKIPKRYTCNSITS